MNEVIDKNHERIRSFFTTIDTIADSLGRVVANYKPALNGESYLTDRELSQRLKVSRRTLQDWRDHGQIPFIQLRGKILYRESDIEKLLQANYRKAVE